MLRALGQHAGKGAVLITSPEPFLEVFEHSPWVTQRAFAEAPFEDARAMFEAMGRAVEQASPDEKLALIRAHPELGTTAAPLTAASEGEQARAGLKNLDPEEHEKFFELNRAYQEKFTFPFVICVGARSKAEILAEFEARLANDVLSERDQALREIAQIAWLRIQTLLAQKPA